MPRPGARVMSLVLASLAGVLVGVCGYTFNRAEGLSYLSDDPAACMNCHIMREQHDGWQKGPHHAAATCNDCHVPHTSLIAKYAVKAEHGYRHSKGFTFQNFHEPIRMNAASRDVALHNCVRCHDAFVGELTAHRFGRGEAIDCIRCHPGAGHGAAG